MMADVKYMAKDVEKPRLLKYNYAFKDNYIRYSDVFKVSNEIMNVFENIKNNLGLVTYPNALWAAHIDCVHNTIAMLHLNPQAVEFVINIDKALIIKLNVNDVSNLLFALENYHTLIPFNNVNCFHQMSTDYNFANNDEPIIKTYKTATEKQQLLICEFCNKISKNRGTHYKHLRTHNTSSCKQFLCNTCGKTFRNNYHLNEHLATHAGNAAKRYGCDLCQKTFSTSSNLKAHIKTHTGERHHVCNTCGKTYTTSSNLQTHIRSIHQDDKPYSCGICEMRFVHPRALRLHMLKHTKERPFKCTMCDKCFPKKVHLTVHIRSHTGEKPYVCGTCGKCFATGGNMKSHMKMH